MASVLHGSARTTPRVRAELQEAQASSRTLARQYGIDPKTVLKWRKRTTTADAPMGPAKPRSTTLTEAEEASADEPLLALALSLDMAMIADLMLMLERGGGVVPAAPRSMVSTPVDGNVAATTLRLLQALADPLETRVLAPSILREIYFHVLLGPQGGAIRTALAHRGGFGRISNALQRIQRDFAQSLTVAELACEVHLSVPAFHAQFKAVTHTSPLQYIKATRLHQARILMLRDSNTAAAAAAKVGYLSASQFGREFKRFFGRSPAEEARCMRAPLSLAPARELTRFDLVH